MPPNLHLTVTAASAGQLQPFLTDLAAGVSAAVSHGPVVLDQGLVAALQALDPSTLTSEEFGFLLAGAGLGDGSGGFALPPRMAEVNALLAVAPPRLRERLLVEFLGLLYVS